MGYRFDNPILEEIGDFACIQDAFFVLGLLFLNGKLLEITYNLYSFTSEL